MSRNNATNAGVQSIEVGMVWLRALAASDGPM